MAFDPPGMATDRPNERDPAVADLRLQQDDRESEHEQTEEDADRPQPQPSAALVDPAPLIDLFVDVAAPLLEVLVEGLRASLQLLAEVD